MKPAKLNRVFVFGGRPESKDDEEGKSILVNQAWEKLEKSKLTGLHQDLRVTNIDQNAPAMTAKVNPIRAMPGPGV